MEVTDMLTERLKQLRKSLKLNQSDIAAVLSISREAYSMYETGKRQPSYESIILLADYYKVNTDYMLGRTDIPEPIPFISKEELFLIQLFRKADKRGKENIITIIKHEASISTTER